MGWSGGRTSLASSGVTVRRGGWVIKRVGIGSGGRSSGSVIVVFCESPISDSCVALNESGERDLRGISRPGYIYTLMSITF